MGLVSNVSKNVSQIDSYRYKPKHRSILSRHSYRGQQLQHNKPGNTYPVILYLSIAVFLLLYSLTTPLYKTDTRSQEWKILFFASNMLIILLFTLFLYQLCHRGYNMYAWLLFVSNFVLIYVVVYIYSAITGVSFSKKKNVEHNINVPRDTQVFNSHVFGPSNSYEQQPKSYKQQ
jgi:hypothetical protein